jgi:hypothetical protein
LLHEANVSDLAGIGKTRAAPRHTVKPISLLLVILGQCLHVVRVEILIIVFVFAIVVIAGALVRIAHYLGEISKELKRRN